MNAHPDIPRCVPPMEFDDLPYHWMQWRTAFRSDAPQPWRWGQHARQWHAASGQLYSPERAAAMHWHYLQPVHVPVAAVDEQHVIQIAHLLDTLYYSHRFQKPVDDSLVINAAKENPHRGMNAAYALIEGLARLGLGIMRK